MDEGIEVFVKIRKSWGGGWGLGGYERRIEVIVKMQNSLQSQVIIFLH